jgi:hypothetical protein
MSKMQDILDKVTELNRMGGTREAIEQLVEAIKLLSLGQQQVMQDIDKHKGQVSRDLGPYVRIG